MRTLSTFSKAMAQVMKSRMAFHGISQSEMANAIEISQSQLSKILRADRAIDLDTFAAFCEAIGESPTDLIKEGEQFTEKIKRNNPKAYVNAAREHLVSLNINDINDDVPLTADGEVDYTELTRRFNPEELGLAAYRDPNKNFESQTPAD